MQEILPVILSGIGLAFACIAVWFSSRQGSVYELKAKVQAQGLQIEDLADRLEQWSKRDRVRKFREAKEEAVVESVGTEAPAAPDYRAAKAALRARLRGHQ